MITLKYTVVSVMFWVVAVVQAATPIPVPFGAAEDKHSPTFSLLYEYEKARATMVVILGGEGRIGVHEKTRGTKTQTALMTTLLTDPSFSKNPINVVIFDSPAPLTPVHLRYGPDHLDRIRSVISFYKARYSHPIILLGHSNGSTSVSEYFNKYAQSPEIAGLVVSASKADLTLKPPLSVPVLFLHHADDQCRLTMFSSASRSFERVKSLNTKFTGLAVVKGGESSGDPCRDGKHMYFGAYDEAARFVEEFIQKYALGS
jgi:hypothetical protein